MSKRPKRNKNIDGFSKTPKAKLTGLHRLTLYILSIHFGFLLSHSTIPMLPLSPSVSESAVSFATSYVDPIFRQRWFIFATPLKFNDKFLVRGYYLDKQTGKEKTTEWLDIGEEITVGLQENRFSDYNYYRKSIDDPFRFVEYGQITSAQIFGSHFLHRKHPNLEFTKIDLKMGIVSFVEGFNSSPMTNFKELPYLSPERSDNE